MIAGLLQPIEIGKIYTRNLTVNGYKGSVTFKVIREATLDEWVTYTKENNADRWNDNQIDMAKKSLANGDRIYEIHTD